MSHPNQTIYSKRDVENCMDYLSGRSYDASLVKSWYNECQVKNQGLYLQYGHDWLQIIPHEKIGDTLRQFLEDPSSAAFSRDRIYERIKTQYLGISKRDIEAWLRTQEWYQLSHRYVRPKIVSPINVSDKVNSHWSIDLVDFQKYSHKPGNRNFSWILSMIDIFSKKLYTIPLKDKTAVSIAVALKQFFSNHDRPIVLQSDNDPSFKSGEVSGLMKELKIKTVFSKPGSPTSNGMVERVQGTVKRMIYNYWHIYNIEGTWLPLLKPLTDNYNNTVHSTTWSTPDELVVASPDDWNFKVAKARIEQHIKSIRKAPVFNVFDKVRLATKATADYKANPLQKVINNWTKEIYTVRRILKPKPYIVFTNPLYLLDNGHAYNGFELQKVDVNNLQTAILNPQNPNDSNFWNFLPRNRSQTHQQVQEQQVEEEEIPLQHRNVSNNSAPVNQTLRRGTRSRQPNSLLKDYYVQ